MSTISPEARRELVTAVAERYQHSTSAEKGWILDEFVALTGYHRKHAIRLLNGSSVTPGVRRGRRCVYDDAVTDRLRAVLGTVDPLGLLDEIRAVQHHLAGLAAGATVHPMPQRDADLDGFLRSLKLAWRAGEVRPTHRPRKRPPRHWRTRRDPFETTWPRVVQLLEAEPHRTAKELFERLRREHPGRFLPGQLRTLQRRVKDWRRVAARRLLFSDPSGASQGAPASVTTVPELHPRDPEPDDTQSGHDDTVALARVAR